MKKSEFNFGTFIDRKNDELIGRLYLNETDDIGERLSIMVSSPMPLIDWNAQVSISRKIDNLKKEVNGKIITDRIWNKEYIQLDAYWDMDREGEYTNVHVCRVEENHVPSMVKIRLTTYEHSRWNLNRIYVDFPGFERCTSNVVTGVVVGCVMLSDEWYDIVVYYDLHKLYFRLISDYESILVMQCSDVLVKDKYKVQIKQSIKSSNGFITEVSDLTMRILEV